MLNFTVAASSQMAGPPPDEIQEENLRALISSHVPSEEGEASSQTASQVKAGRGWHTLMTRLARTFDS
ncbi:hypothetical protein J6590_039648 [Homalodisca vitripennis]|nr:hypothetical protein J6590_039648 [Homalodisca vitripennis]